MVAYSSYRPASFRDGDPGRRRANRDVEGAVNTVLLQEPFDVTCGVQHPNNLNPMLYGTIKNAVYLLDAGADVAFVQDRLGHATLQNTLVSRRDTTVTREA